MDAARPRAPWLPLLMVLLLTLPTLVAAGPTASNDAPDPPADTWWTRSSLDQDGDRVGDALEHQLQRTPASEPVRLLVDYATPPTPAQVTALEERGATVTYEAQVVPTLVAEAPARAVPNLATAPGVVLLEQDRTLHPLLDESRPQVKAQRASQEYGVTGDGVTIAIFDTGVDKDHPDLGPKLLARYDATRQQNAVTSLLGATKPVQPGDTDGHGTHVAGIAAGPGTQSGGTYVGIAPDADLVSVKVFDAQGQASTSYVLRGIDWALAHKGQYNIRIMQMSLGGNGTDGTDAVSRAIGVASDRGLLTVAAAGNRGPDEGTITLPGVAPKALTVAAVDGEHDIARFSSRGPTVDGRRKPDLSAPGVAIKSTAIPIMNEGAYYSELSGTSMAAPHAAGAAALLVEANQSLSAPMLKWILTASSEPLGPTPHAWHHAYGYGFLDVRDAVRAAQDPNILGEPPFAETARNVPYDGGASEIDHLLYRAERVQRTWVPGPGLLLVSVGLVAAAVLQRRIPRA